MYADTDGVHFMMGAVDRHAEASRRGSFDRNGSGASVDVDLERHPRSASRRAPCFQRVMVDPPAWPPACALARMYASSAGGDRRELLLRAVEFAEALAAPLGQQPIEVGRVVVAGGVRRAGA